MRYTFIQQQDATDCAAACLAMICLHYKKETTITKLRDIMGTDIKGTNLLGVGKCAEKLGFATQAVRVDKEGFLSKYTLPAIANVFTKEGLSHFVVIFKISKKYVVIGDPAKDLMRIETDKFYQNFSGVLMLLKPNEGFVQSKEKQGSMLHRFAGLLWPQKKLFAYSILSSLILTVLGIVSSLFNKILMDEILPYKLENTLLIVLLIFALISITQAIIGFLRQWIMIFLSQKIDIPLMLGYFEHIYKLPMKFFATRKTGDIITRFSDAFTIKNIFTNISLTLVMDIGMALVTGILLLQMNGQLFLVIAFMTILSIFMVFIFKQPYKKINEQQMHQGSVLNSQIIEGLRAVETIKGNASESTEFENIEREYIKSLRISMQEGMLSNIQSSISGLVSTMGNLLLMYLGIMQVIHNEMTLGSLMAFTTLSGYFMSPIGRLVGLQLQIQEANISMKRMAEILDYEQEQGKEGSEMNLKDMYLKLDKVQGNIELRKVTFRYGSRKPVLKDVSFTIPHGKKVALVGGSGSGKSTIAKLLLKYYEPETGEILIDGIDIQEYENQSLRSAISYVPQACELFSKSIYDNIRLSRMDASLDEVKEAAKAAGAHDFIKKLPMQYYTYLEEAGNGLSGGEKQRITLARAFLRDSQFYILDESTSNLDFGTENIIFDMIYNRFRDKTMLIIAHRLSSIRLCDEIIVLDEGEIVEQGTHEQLLKKRGKYYELWELQQGNFTKTNERPPAEEYVVRMEEDAEGVVSYT